MLDSNIELYGPYSRPLLNCRGGGTCGTCIVEVVEGKELLNPRTDKEKEKLKRVVIQQLPEWKGHEWNYNKEPPSESEP
ncbi:photosynthetic NDH subunit of subcomplex B 3, chloroplastic-like isoform X2 [Camellia sinensis]|uniref:photosynthetic NDH subunit of subcomplex B 3, chloroplastic-like isoform X2 n=1 Tax=Camellia sinensis TaxID=4442 RepID=UPI001035CBF4|nr:photosynthetic NDH subunit of subcomplex B 3, chloroplastic-like isoform X2 [Camellia sinensis]